MANDSKEQTFTQLDFAIIDTALELGKLLYELDPNDQRTWVRELKAARIQIVETFIRLKDELGVPRSAEIPLN